MFRLRDASCRTFHFVFRYPTESLTGLAQIRCTCKETWGQHILKYAFPPRSSARPPPTPKPQRVRRREHLLLAFEQLPHNRPLRLRIAICLLDRVVQPLNGRAHRYSYEGLLAQTLPRYYWLTGELLVPRRQLLRFGREDKALGPGGVASIWLTWQLGDSVI